MVEYSVVACDARVAELADAQDLGSCGETRGGSTPLSRTNLRVAVRIFYIAVREVLGILSRRYTVRA